MPTPLIVLTETEITDNLLTNGEVMQRFKFLQPVLMRKNDLGGCRPCELGPKGEALKAAIKDAQRHIAMMNASDKAELKRMLNAQAVRVYYVTNSDGRMMRQRVDF